jgi:hypothetical protein
MIISTKYTQDVFFIGRNHKTATRYTTIALPVPLFELRIEKARLLKYKIIFSKFIA